MEQKVYHQEVCEDLSMKTYRGLPRPSKDFKDNCDAFKLTYHQEHCQKALQYLMLGADELRLKKKYGVKIMGCFNKSDLDRFLRRPIESSEKSQD